MFSRHQATSALEEKDVGNQESTGENRKHTACDLYRNQGCIHPSPQGRGKKSQWSHTRKINLNEDSRKPSVDRSQADAMSSRSMPLSKGEKVINPSATNPKILRKEKKKRYRYHTTTLVDAKNTMKWAIFLRGVLKDNTLINITEGWAAGLHRRKKHLPEPTKTGMRLKTYLDQNTKKGRMAVPAEEKKADIGGAFKKRGKSARRASALHKGERKEPGRKP